MRSAENRTPHSYPDLASAVQRMKEANPFLSDDVAEHLTLHGTNWNADGSIIWKFDNFARVGAPYGMNTEEATAVMSRITCPVLLFWGRQSFAMDPDAAPEAAVMRDKRMVKVDHAGHWVHHDQLEFFCGRRRSFWRSDCAAQVGYGAKVLRRSEKTFWPQMNTDSQTVFCCGAARVRYYGNDAGAVTFCQPSPFNDFRNSTRSFLSPSVSFRGLIFSSRFGLPPLS